MKNKILIIIIMCLIFIYITMCFSKKETFFLPNNEVQVRLKIDEEIVSMNLENYIIGVVAAEMPALYEKEALKAQAIAARTYALYKIEKNNQEYDLTVSVNNQMFNDETTLKEKWAEKYTEYYLKIKGAVDETKNLVLKSNGEIICAYYFSTSNGKTENAVNVFGTTLDYAFSVDSKWDKKVKNYEVTTNYEKSTFCQLLNVDCQNINISNLQINDTNHVDNLQVNNKLFSGIEFRKLLNLRSTDFDIQVEDKVYITTRGYGHGVGMSQNGANEMAKEGYSYEEILMHYYKNTTIENLNV